MDILIIGDSHAECRLPDGRDAETIADALGVPDKYRLARSGSTARQWLDPANPWLSEALQLAKECDSVFISIGGNDLFRDYIDGKVTREEAERICADIRDIVTRFSDKRVFLLVYGDPYKGTEMMSIAGVICITIAYRLFTQDLPYVILVLETSLLSPDDWCGHDIHPNESGYLKIAEFIRKEMEK